MDAVSSFVSSLTFSVSQTFPPVALPGETRARPPWSAAVPSVLFSVSRGRSMGDGLKRGFSLSCLGGRPTTQIWGPWLLLQAVPAPGPAPRHEDVGDICLVTSPWTVEVGHLPPWGSETFVWLSRAHGEGLLPPRASATGPVPARASPSRWGHISSVVHCGTLLEGRGFLVCPHLFVSLFRVTRSLGSQALLSSGIFRLHSSRLWFRRCCDL